MDVFAFGTMMWEVMANDIPFVTWLWRFGTMASPRFDSYWVWSIGCHVMLILDVPQCPTANMTPPQANLDPADIRERVVEGEGFFILAVGCFGDVAEGRRCHNFSLAVG